uniref:Uncharacterized protein n=1 Tax=Phaeomonas parva TaxID=124430 RepID=A0A7S1TQC6_9STRA|mmetsp:Transcript_12808/g.38443  ORF Transcript_12808/g.38443 Transcript_12808/m.38443 type:complete len:331 (+) Transcript_12808:179-1171(+)
MERFSHLEEAVREKRPHAPRPGKADSEEEERAPPDAHYKGTDFALNVRADLLELLLHHKYRELGLDFDCGVVAVRIHSAAPADIWVKADADLAPARVVWGMIVDRSEGVAAKPRSSPVPRVAGSAKRPLSPGLQAAAANAKKLKTSVAMAKGAQLHLAQKLKHAQEDLSEAQERAQKVETANARLRQEKWRLYGAEHELLAENDELMKEGERLQRENERLFYEEAALREENAQLHREEAALRDENSKLREEEQQLRLLNEQLRHEDSALKHRVEVCQKKRRELAHKVQRLQTSRNRFRISYHKAREKLEEAAAAAPTVTKMGPPPVPMPK